MNTDNPHPASNRGIVVHWDRLLLDELTRLVRGWLAGPVTTYSISTAGLARAAAQTVDQILRYCPPDDRDEFAREFWAHLEEEWVQS